MPNYTGTLMIISNQSTLDNSLLLKAGYPDPAQAMYEATRFLIKDRGLGSGQQIVVTGVKGTVGTASVISMSDAHAAGPPQPDALLPNIAADTVETNTAAKPKKPGAKKTKAAGKHVSTKATAKTKTDGDEQKGK
jgi:hypothetical protein